MFPAAELWAAYASTFFGIACMLVVFGAVCRTRGARISRRTCRGIKVASFAVLGGVWGLAAGLVVDVYCFLAGFDLQSLVRRPPAWAGLAGALLLLVVTQKRAPRDG